MGEIPGMERPDLQALPQIGDRLTFLYLEHLPDQPGRQRNPGAG